MCNLHVTTRFVWIEKRPDEWERLWARVGPVPEGYHEFILEPEEWES